MTAQDILHLRIHNQLLTGNKLKNPHEVVAYMGAMQSQAFDMARWAIGTRIPGITDNGIKEAINSARIIRTHILRPTWHFVAAEDIHWMLDLSSPRLKPIYESYHRMAGLEDILYVKRFPHIEKVLADDKHLTNIEISGALETIGLSVGPETVNRILRFAELDGLICNGKVNGTKQTFCLLQERVPKKGNISKEEALEKLARKFFTSHAPATIDDFVWWSGLLASDAKKGLELIKDDFVSEEINGRTFWMQNSMQVPKTDDDSVLLLPPFDEFVVSYKNRSEMIDDEHYGKVMTKNGLFSPTAMLNGRIVGSWKKIKKGKKLEVELSFFEKTTKKTEDKFRKAEKAYLDYMQEKK